MIELRLDFDKCLELPDAMEIYSERYKTSIIYGKKIIHLPTEIFQELQIYQDITRPHFVSDKNPFFITTLKGPGKKLNFK